MQSLVVAYIVYSDHFEQSPEQANIESAIEKEGYIHLFVTEYSVSDPRDTSPLSELQSSIFFSFSVSLNEPVPYCVLELKSDVRLL